MSRYDPRDPERRTDSGRPKLNEFFVDGKGINREIFQKNLCRYLGAEAWARRYEYRGVKGYLVTAVRSFTADMLDELRELSDAYEQLARCHQKGNLRALSYEEFEASRREEAAFAQSGTGYTYSQRGYQARDYYPTASPLPGYPPPHGFIADSERPHDAGSSAYWSPTGVKYQQDLTRESDATRAVSLSSKANDLATRQPDPRGTDRPFSQDFQDPRLSQSRENAYGSRGSYSSDYTAGYGYPQHTSSSYSINSSQNTAPILCSSCREQAGKSKSTTPCSACRPKATPTANQCEKSSSSYSCAVSVGASLLVGVVASGVGAEYTARTVIQSLQR